MPKKSTSNLENELKNTASLDLYLEENQEEMTSDSIPVLLQNFLALKNITKAEAVRDSNLNEIYAYQIFSGTRRPSRDKLLCLCFSMKATLEETQSLLKRSDFPPLYARSQRDSIIMYALSHQRTIIQLNDDLFEHGEAVLE